MNARKRRRKKTFEIEMWHYEAFSKRVVSGLSLVYGEIMTQAPKHPSTTTAVSVFG